MSVIKSILLHCCFYKKIWIMVCNLTTRQKERKTKQSQLLFSNSIIILVNHACYSLNGLIFVNMVNKKQPCMHHQLYVHVPYGCPDCQVSCSIREGNKSVLKLYILRNFTFKLFYQIIFELNKKWKLTLAQIISICFPWSFRPKVRLF